MPHAESIIFQPVLHDRRNYVGDRKKDSGRVEASSPEGMERKTNEREAVTVASVGRSSHESCTMPAM